MSLVDSNVYRSSTHIRKHFDISNQTLINWAKEGKVNVVQFPTTKKRLYDVRQLAGLLGVPHV